MSPKEIGSKPEQTVSGSASAILSCDQLHLFVTVVFVVGRVPQEHRTIVVVVLLQRRRRRRRLCRAAAAVDVDVAVAVAVAVVLLL